MINVHAVRMQEHVLFPAFGLVANFRRTDLTEAKHLTLSMGADRFVADGTGLDCISVTVRTRKPLPFDLRRADV